MRRFITVLVAVILVMPVSSFAATQDELMQKIQELTRQLEELRKQVEGQKVQRELQEKRLNIVEEKTDKVDEKWSWLEIGGDYRFRIDSLKGEVPDYYRFQDVLGWMLGGPPPVLQEGYDVRNDSIMFNRFRLRVNARVTEDIEVRSRLAMYKTWGHQTTDPIAGDFFGDRAMGAFDGTVGHLPQDSVLRVDYAYATWSNIADLPLWFSIGRRASTGGLPTNVRQYTDKGGTEGVAGLLIDYAFDGLTIGAAPYIEALPGFYAKFCYGRGFDSGFKTDIPGDITPKDTDFMGIFIDPIFTETLNIEFNYVRAINIFDNMPDAGVRTNVGDIDLWGANVKGTIKNVGPGNLNLFASAALSKTHPNDNLFMIDITGDGVPDMGLAGLLYDAPAMGGTKESHTGNAVYVGARYDFVSTKTMLGVEYNRGSKYWITFAPAADDLWTSKLGTRGEVYEVYAIQELSQVPIAKRGKAFFRIGYQYYDFEYTGSNNWLGEPKKIADLKDPSNAQMLTPIKNAHDIYLTFDVVF